MRNIFMLIIAMLAINGCKNGGNPVSSETRMVNSLQYTFATSKTSFGIHDTLIATMTVYNPTDVPETIYVGLSVFNWSLQNQSGRIIMYGPWVSNWSLYKLPINPHQSKIIYNIRQAIADTSGAPVTAGSYNLKANMGSNSFLLTLTLR